MKKIFTILIALFLSLEISNAYDFTFPTYQGWKEYGTVGSGSNVRNRALYKWDQNGGNPTLGLVVSFKTSNQVIYDTRTYPGKGTYTFSTTESAGKVAAYYWNISGSKRYSYWLNSSGTMYYPASGTVTFGEGGGDAPYVTCNSMGVENSSGNNIGSVSFACGTVPTYATVTVNCNDASMGSANSIYKSGYIYPDSRDYEYKVGSTYTLVATANSGYEFVEWRKDGSSISTDASTDVEITGNATYTAYFAPNDGSIYINATTDSYIDNTGADAEWQSWSFAGKGTGTDNKQYSVALKYNASSTVGSFASSLADPELTLLYQGTTNIEWTEVNTTVSIDNSGTSTIKAILVDKDGQKYVVTAVITDECATSQQTEPQTAWYAAYKFNNSSDHITVDIFTDPQDWEEPGYGMWGNDHNRFIRVTAYNNTGTYVQCFLWAGANLDANTQAYANGITGPKAGTYSISVDPDVNTTEDASGLSVWWVSNESYVTSGKAIFFNQRGWIYNGYWSGYSDIYLECMYSTFVAQTSDGTSFSNIQSMEGFSINVAEGKDGYPYIEFVDTQGAVAITIGEPVIQSGYKLDTYVNGRGSVTVTPEQCFYVEGAEITLTPVAEEGWTFTGWTGTCKDQITDKGNGTYTFTVPAQDCAVIANFEESIGYSLTWDFNGGVTTSQDNEYTHGKIPEGEFIVAPADPTLDGYQFAGWLNSVKNVVETAEAGMMPSLMPGENLTYTAQWTANACAYTVHFDSNGGSGTMTDQEFTCGVADNLIPNEFVGPAATITYNYHGATNGNGTPSVTVNKPFGVWEDNVVEESHDDEEDVDFSVSNGETVTMTAQWRNPSVTLPTPEKTGYSFNGWYTEETGGTKKGEGGASFNPAGDITLHAQWTANTYTVHFDSNHGEAADEMGDQTFTYDVEQALTANGFEWTGHTFQGWATEENGGVVYTDQQTVINLTAENNAIVNLYAVWETNSYSVTFQDTEADGGNVWWSSDFAYDETPVYGGTETPAKADDSQYSYEFAGWKDVDGVEYPTGTALPAVEAEATYYAVYNQTVLQYTLTWDVNDGDALTGDYTQGDVEWGTAISAPDDPTKEGYQFGGWVSSITNEVEIPSVMPAADLTYTAQWTANTYTVHFDSNHGEAADEMGDQTFTYDVEQALTANGYEWTGHTFQGWATEENGEVVYTDQENVINLTAENNATVNLYAVWEVNDYTVTFQDTEADGGYVWWSGSFAYGETPVYGGETEPYKDATDEYIYTFTGWTDGVTEYPSGTDLPEVTGDATYYAMYTSENVQYTLTWDVSEGNNLEGNYTQGEVEWGMPIIAPEDPTREGYQFGGWVSSITNEVETPAEMPASDLTYTAQWTANTYTVHFDSNHGEAVDEMGDQTFTYDVEQALAANGFEWTGHTFQGWATEENGEVVYTDQENVINLTAENNATVNLYAVWEVNSYTVTFQDTEADGGHVWWSGSFAYGETPVYGGENEPSKESTDEHTYTFTGWTDGVNEYPVGSALHEVTDNAVYYAVYSESDALFTIRFENPDGSELQTYQLPLGATPAYEGTPAQENEGDAYNYYMFTFTGWVDGDDNSYGTDDALPAVTGDITYTAQYSKQLFVILQEQKDDDYYTEFSEKYSGERATTATLNRQFAQGKWATLCLPFNVSKALMTAVGLQNRVYEFKYTKGDTQSGITLYFALASKMEAGKGYIVNANAVLAQKTQLVFYSVLVDTKADIQSGYDISALSGYNSEGNIYLVGTLRRGVLYGDQGNGNYYLGLSNNKIFAANSTTGTNVLAYRGIFRSTEPISAPRVRIVAEGEDGEIVGELEVVNGELEEVTAPKKYVQDGILYIERDGIRYSAQGQRLD